MIILMRFSAFSSPYIFLSSAARRSAARRSPAWRNLPLPRRRRCRRIQKHFFYFRLYRAARFCVQIFGSFLSFFFSFASFIPWVLLIRKTELVFQRCSVGIFSLIYLRTFPFLFENFYAVFVEGYFNFISSLKNFSSRYSPFFSGDFFFILVSNRRKKINFFCALFNGNLWDAIYRLGRTLFSFLPRESESAVVFVFTRFAFCALCEIVYKTEMLSWFHYGYLLYTYPRTIYKIGNYFHSLCVFCTRHDRTRRDQPVFIYKFKINSALTNQFSPLIGCGVYGDLGNFSLATIYRIKE